jgi:MinD-like ATPase involved in chromosome partitioning or flagellar assembly
MYIPAYGIAILLPLGSGEEKPVANKDKDHLAGAEDDVLDEPATARGAASAGDAQAPGEGNGQVPHPNGDQHESGGDARAPGADDEVPATRADDADADSPKAVADGAEDPLPPGPEHRPAGFASGFVQPYPPGPGGEPVQPGVQASPYESYGDYGGQEQGYEGYGQPEGYGPGYADYGQAPGYQYPPGGYGQGYPAQAYPEGYGPAQPYEDQGYGGDPGYDQGQYGQYEQGPRYDEAPAYGPGPGYGQPYGQGQAAYAPPGYGQAPYGPGQPYGQAPYGPGYGPDQGYGQPQGYPAPQAPQTQPAGPEADRSGEQPAAEPLAGQEEAREASDEQSGDRDDRDAAAEQSVPPGTAQAQASAQSQAPAQGQGQASAGAGAAPSSAGPGAGPGRSPGSASPYPPQDSYRWPPSYETQTPGAPSQPRPGPYGPPPYGQGRGDTQTGYPPRAPQAGGPQGGAPQAGGPQARGPQAQAPGGETLTPLPIHGPEQPQAAETSDDLTADALLHGKRQEPAGGWRRAVYRGSGGLIRPRESAETAHRRDLINRVRTPVAGGHHRVAVMSLKGGVGKTTTTVGLGSMLASLRGDRIIALDANPDRGTLSDKVRLETAATVRDLLNERDQIHRYADVRAFTSQAPSRLEVLASDRDPAVSIAFSEEDYYDAARVLEHYYSISLTDCGTGLLHSAMAGVLRMADQIVLVSSPSVDGARSASATLDWLEAHDYGDLVRNAVVVLSMIRPRSKSSVDLDRLEHHFAGRCRAVVRIPYDAHLEEGAEVDLEQMSPPTFNAYLELAATVGDGFAWPRRAARQSALAANRQRWADRPSQAHR